MKIGIFTDSHYSSKEVTCGRRYNSQSLRKMQEAYDAFVAEKCDLVICLGDLTDVEDSHGQEVANLKKCSELINRFPVKTICVMGNHDGFDFTQEEFYGILGESCIPKTICAEGKTLLFLDACYFKTGEHYQPGDSDWTDTFYPYEKELAEELEAHNEVYVFMHQNIDENIPENHCLYNARQIREILENSQKVKAVYQGHFHPGYESINNGITYQTFPAMCEVEKGYFVLEL